MATSPLFGWEEPDDVDLVKDGAAAIRTLGNAIDTSMGDLLGGTTGQVLSKASNTNMDFTWVTSDDANAIQNAIVDAKGDLIAASAADTPARLAVGNNGETLVADSSTATGLKWAKSGLTLITRSSFSAVASATFDSVFSSTYPSYLIQIETIYSATGSNTLQIQFRYGTTTQTTGYYGNHLITSYANTTITNNNINNVSQMSILKDIGSQTEPSSVTMTVLHAGSGTKYPLFYGQGMDGRNYGYNQFGGLAGGNQTFTGFLLKDNAGANISGTVAIYGYGA